MPRCAWSWPQACLAFPSAPPHQTHATCAVVRHPRSLPRAMYLSLEDKGSVFSILKNWPERRIKAICLTDGQSVGHLGDLGVQVWVGVGLGRLPLVLASGKAGA